LGTRIIIVLGSWSIARVCPLAIIRKTIVEIGGCGLEGYALPISGRRTNLTVIRDNGLIAENRSVAHIHRASNVASFADDRTNDRRTRADSSTAAHNRILDSRAFFYIAVAAHD
jgi:hypothetical protein